ncbi:MAG: glycosyltransferase family 39 protein [Burkholderiaceae bacterium]
MQGHAPPQGAGNAGVHYSPVPSATLAGPFGAYVADRWGRLARVLKLDGSQLLLLLILSVSAALRFHALGQQPLWLDEGYSWWDAQQSWADIWRLVPQCDPHPPLYFVLLKGWTGLFGDGALAMRALSASMGVATTAVIYLAGRQISRPIGLVAALFFALTPFQIEFAHEARPYALLCLGGSLIVYGALRALRDRRAGIGWAALTIGSLIVLWANNTSVLIVASMVGGFGLLMALDQRMRKRWHALLVALAVIGVCWLPYLPLLIEQARGVSSDFWIPKPIGWRFTNELRFVVSLSSYEAVYWAVAALFGGLVLLWRRGYWRQAILLAALGGAPVLLNYGVSMVSRSIFIGRALIGVAPAMAIMLACAVMLIGSVRWRALALVALLAAHGLAIVVMVENDKGKEPWDKIASQLAGSMSEDGALQNANAAVVLTVPNELVLPLAHAMEELHMRMPVRGAPANFPSPGLAARYPSGKCAPSVAGWDLGRLASLINGRRIVYFITRQNNAYDPGNRIAGFLRSQGLASEGMRRFMPGFLEVHKFVAPVLRRGAAASAPTGAVASAPTHGSVAAARHGHDERMPWP